MAKPYVDLASFLKAPRLAPGSTELPEGPNPTAFLGLAFDLATEYRPGARFGPNAVRAMSGTFTNDDHPTLGVSPGDRLTLVDAGDVEAAYSVPASLLAIEARAKALTRAGAHVVGCGGDHTVTLPLLRAAAERDGPLGLVQFDAHMDTWEPPPGLDAYHGSFVRNAVEEGIVDPARTVMVGIRAPHDREVVAWTRDRGITVITAEEVHLMGPGPVLARILSVVGTGDGGAGKGETGGDGAEGGSATGSPGAPTVRIAPAYITFDMDAIDPSQAPGTSTPEPGGLWTWQALALIRDLATARPWSGFDVVEIAPAYDHADLTALTAANLLWGYLCGVVKWLE
ncbi:MAG: arginase family protein [Azospirillaceae bacterium]